MKGAKIFCISIGALLVSSSVSAKHKGMHDIQRDFSTVTTGARLFGENCASCHGQNAQGGQGQRKKNKSAVNPAPPLNGTGHAWHHSLSQLRQSIKEGGAKTGGHMPGFGNKLSEQEMNAIISWFQSKWPKEIFDTWKESNNHHGRH